RMTLAQMPGLGQVSRRIGGGAGLLSQRRRALGGLQGLQIYRRHGRRRNVEPSGKRAPRTLDDGRLAAERACLLALPIRAPLLREDAERDERAQFLVRNDVGVRDAAVAHARRDVASARLRIE